MIFQTLAQHGALLRAPRAMNHPVCKVEVQGFLPIELPPLPSGQTLKLVQEAEGGGSSAAEIADASGVWSAEDATTWRRIAEYVEDELADTLSVGGRLWPSAAESPAKQWLLEDYKDSESDVGEIDELGDEDVGELGGP